MENLRARKSESTDLPAGFEERLSMKSNNSPTFQNKKKVLDDVVKARDRALF